MSVLVYVLPLVLVLVLIFSYGSVKNKLGAAIERGKKRKAQRAREAKAKAIESKPAPTKPNDVADAWDELR